MKLPVGNLGFSGLEVVFERCAQAGRREVGIKGHLHLIAVPFDRDARPNA